MKGDLATALLSSVMSWNEEQLATERIFIEMMAELKYDEYQQYSQGMRYVESLSQWLDKFEVNDREILYTYLKNNLIFISSIEMRQLIDISFHSQIKPLLLKDAEKLCKNSNFNSIEERKTTYKYCRRSTLFLGLSDGAHIDIFRRDHPFLSNEQVHVHYDYSLRKHSDILIRLKDDLEKYDLSLADNKSTFRNIVLLDDFSASGISFIRTEDGKWKGKIPRFFDQLNQYEFDFKNTNIYIVIYAATKNALENIRSSMEKYKSESGWNMGLSVSAIQLIESNDLCNIDLERILEKYYTNYNMQVIETEHYKKGRMTHPYLGFNECSLPLVIFHNSPNNSLPIIWYDEVPFKGLFPRVSRHKEEL